jgi:hypothetical protein
MKKFCDIAVPFVGIEIDFSPIYHFFRDLLVVFILWQIGYRGFQAAFTTMLISGFFEAGNGICFLKDGTHCHFDFLDVIPSVFAGFLIVSLLSENFDLTLLLNLLLIYFSVVLILLFLNITLGRKIIIK